MRLVAWIALMACSLAPLACQGGAVSRAKPPVKISAKATPAPAPAATLSETARIIDQSGTPTQLIGKVKLLSDHGAGILSNNTGNLISDHGGGLISDHGAGLVANNGAGAPNPARRTLLDTAPPPEALLADAQIEVLDAAHHYLAGPDHQALATHTDAQGNYTFKAVLPVENLLFRVRLFNGGQLEAIVPKDGRATGTQVSIDTASTLGASYVLGRYVNGRQEVFDRLPAVEARTLHDDADAARAGLDGVPSYQPDDMVAATETLRGKAKALDATLTRIRSILLAGQQDLGNGKDATQVALAVPVGLAGDAAGNLYIAEQGAFRIRKVDPAGKIGIVAGVGARSNGTNQAQTLEDIGGVAMGPDGNLYVTQMLTGQVRRVKPDGTVEPVFPGAASLVRPTAIAFAPDGTMYVGEERQDSTAGHLWVYDPRGQAHILSLPPELSDGGSIRGLAVTTTGDLVLASDHGDGLVLRFTGGKWSTVATGLALGKFNRMAAGPHGEVYLAEQRGHDVLRIDADDKRTVIAGTGTAGDAGDGGPATSALLNEPSGTFCAADGTVYVADLDGLVRKVAKGTITTLAGTHAVIPGDALTIPINGPGGLTLDAQGRVVFSEAGSSLIKRLDGTNLTVIAGTTAGYGGDGGPATAAQLQAPAGVAYGNGNLYVVDSANFRIRKIDARGVITTVASKPGVVPDDPGPGPYPSDQVPMVSPLLLATGPDGTPYWTDAKSQEVLHLRADGLVEVVAGQFNKSGNSGDGGPATAAKLAYPTGLAFDKTGDLYICDTQNLTVRKIALSQPVHTITRVAGMSLEQTVGAIAAAVASGGVIRNDAREEGIQATDTALLGPVGICFDAEANMFIAEMGTAKLASFGGTGGLSPDLLAQMPQVGTRIRRVKPDGTINLVAGDGTTVLNDPASDESMLYPFNMAVDATGRLIVADSALDQIKLLEPGTILK